MDIGPHNRCPHRTISPNDLLGESVPASSSGRRWLLAYLRSRHEAVYAAYLERSSVPFYLPYGIKRSRSVRRPFGWTPLFHGYAFVCADESEARRARSNDAVVSITAVENQVRLHEELRQIQHLTVSGAPIWEHRHVDAGSLVDIVKGPFAGLRGTVVRFQNALRLVVSITLLRRSLAVELCRDAVAAAHLDAL